MTTSNQRPRVRISTDVLELLLTDRRPDESLTDLVDRILRDHVEVKKQL